jgi:hypothetical protein
MLKGYGVSGVLDTLNYYGETKLSKNIENFKLLGISAYNHFLRGVAGAWENRASFSGQKFSILRWHYVRVLEQRTMVCSTSISIVLFLPHLTVCLDCLAEMNFSAANCLNFKHA